MKNEVLTDHPGTARLLADIEAHPGGIAEDVIDPSRATSPPLCEACKHPMEPGNAVSIPTFWVCWKCGTNHQDVIDPSRSTILTPRYVKPSEEAAKLARAQVMGFYAAADWLARSGCYGSAAGVREEGARFARRLGATL